MVVGLVETPLLRPLGDGFLGLASLAGPSCDPGAGPIEMI